MINDNRHKNNSSRGFNFPYIQSPAPRSNVMPAATKPDPANAPAAEDESTLEAAKSEQPDVSPALDPLRIASVLLAAKGHITNELSAATVSVSSLNETPDESAAAGLPVSDDDNKNPDKLPVPPTLPLAPDTLAVIPDQIAPTDMSAADCAAENADENDIAETVPDAAPLAPDKLDPEESMSISDRITADVAAAGTAAEYADENHIEAAAIAAVPTASDILTEDLEPSDAIKTSSIESANKNHDDAHQNFSNEKIREMLSLDGLYGRGLFHYKDWWFRNKIEISVNGKLICGIPIFTDHNTLRVVNEKHSYFIPIEKIDYIRTSDGLNF